MPFGGMVEIIRNQNVCRQESVNNASYIIMIIMIIMIMMIIMIIIMIIIIMEQLGIKDRTRTMQKSALLGPLFDE